MQNWKRRTAVVAGVVALLALAGSREALAHPRGRVLVYRGGYWGPYWGFGWGYPYWGWGPWGYPGYYPPGGVDLNAAMMAGYGAVELNVKPNRADVWADGRYAGEARDLDGYPTYLWLSDGPHRLAVYKGGYKVFDEQIDVRRGTRTELKIKLEPGESQPPFAKPFDKGQEKAKPADKEKGQDKAKEDEKD
jgi:hypothetical protein